LSKHKFQLFLHFYPLLPYFFVLSLLFHTPYSFHILNSLIICISILPLLYIHLYPTLIISILPYPYYIHLYPTIIISIYILPLIYIHFYPTLIISISILLLLHLSLFYPYYIYLYPTLIIFNFILSLLYISLSYPYYIQLYPTPIISISILPLFYCLNWRITK